jgi:hypothetical protein
MGTMKKPRRKRSRHKSEETAVLVVDTGDGPQPFALLKELLPKEMRDVPEFDLIIEEPLSDEPL